MFRRTTISITIAAIAAIALSTPAPASAAEPPAEEGCVILCGVDYLGLDSIRDFYSPPSLDVTDGAVADVPVLTVTVPDATLDAITDPVVDPSPLPGLPGLPEEPATPAPETAPVDPAPVDPAPAPADHSHGTASSTSDELGEETGAIEPTTTTPSPTTHDDHVDEVAVAAIDLTTAKGSDEAFDPAMAALIGAFGTLGLFGVGTAAFMIGRRGA